MENNIHAKAVTTRGVGVKYGLYSAGFGIFFLVRALLGHNPFDQAWWAGLISLVVSVLLIVLAHREFKESGDGFMSYGQGVGIGFWMALVAVPIALLFQWVYTSFIDPEVMNQFYEAQRIQMEERGAPDSQIDLIQENTKRFFWIFGFIVAMFISVLLAVIVSIFTQKRNPQPAF
jgi:apolipoprotein N-acyltransferase